MNEKSQTTVTHIALTDNPPDPRCTIIDVVQLKEITDKHQAITENFIAQYLSTTGARIEDTVLCQQSVINTGIVRYWCEPKSVNDERPYAPKWADE
jgi:hypothetical protein